MVADGVRGGSRILSRVSGAAGVSQAVNVCFKA